MGDTMNLLAILDTFSFWKLQTTHSRGRRGYECEIRADEGLTHRRRYVARAALKHDAIRLAIAKAQAGQHRKSKHRPTLRLTESEVG